MKPCSNALAALFVGAWLVTSGPIADAAPCLIVTLTGTHGGPQQPFNGQALSLITVFDVATLGNRSRYAIFRDLFSSSNVSTKNTSANRKPGQIAVGQRLPFRLRWQHVRCTPDKLPTCAGTEVGSPGPEAEVPFRPMGSWCYFMASPKRWWGVNGGKRISVL
jgi:hypothetical protein